VARSRTAAEERSVGYDSNGNTPDQRHRLEHHHLCVGLHRHTSIPKGNGFSGPVPGAGIELPTFSGESTRIFGNARASPLPSNCHQRIQTPAKKDKVGKTNKLPISLNPLDIIRRRFMGLGWNSITNRLLYH